MSKEKVSGPSSRETAKERLKGILMRDRVDVSREMLDSLKAELMSVAKDYFVVKEHNCEIYITSSKRNALDENDTVLVCLMPIKKTKSKIAESLS